MNKAIIIATVLITLSYQNLFSRNWERFAEIDSSFPETLVLDNYNSYQVEFEDHVFYANTIINWSINAAGASASAPALPFQRFVYGYLTKIELVACWDDESDTREVIYVYDNQEPYGYSAHGALNVPAGVETGLPSFFGGHKFRLILYCYYTGFYTSIGNDNQLPHNWVTEDDLTFDYYMFESPSISFYVDNLEEPSNPSSIVDQLKSSNILAKWNGGSNEPLVVVEGFDPKNNNYPGWYYNAGKELFDRARYEEGRDVYILNFAEGGNTMATSRNLDQNIYPCTYTYEADDEVVEYGNASVVQDAVKFVSTKTPNGINSVILAGLSMGGVVCRYALAAAEQVGNPLPVSHFLSIDSPQQYATIDYDLMDFVFTQPIVQNGLKEHYSDLPYDERPSLLCYHATLELLWNNPASQYDISSKDPSIVAPSKNHNEFYKQLNRLNGVNRGYPSRCRNLGVSFSTYDGSLLKDYQNKTWLTAEIEAHGDVIFDYTFGSLEEHLDYEGSVDLVEEYYNKRILYAGSRLPLHYTNINVVDESFSMSKSMLMGMLSFDSDIVVRVDTDTKVQPTFIPFVSALDLYDPAFCNSEDKPFLYPQSTYLFVGNSLRSDNTFNFSYAGNQTNFPNPLTQCNYEDDTGTYWPQSNETGGEDFVGVRSRFDEILFNHNEDELGTDHDVFPVNYIDGIFNFLNDKVTENITTWNNTWKNKVVLTKDININDKNTLYIKNGTNNTISIDSDLGMSDQVNLNIKDGATVVVEDNTFLNILKSVHINFEPGSTLILGNNCKIALNNLSYFVINEGVNLELGESYDVKTEGYYARFIWKPNAIGK